MGERESARMRASARERGESRAKRREERRAKRREPKHPRHKLKRELAEPPTDSPRSRADMARITARAERELLRSGDQILPPI